MEQVRSFGKEVRQHLAHHLLELIRALTRNAIPFLGLWKEEMSASSAKEKI